MEAQSIIREQQEECVCGGRDIWEANGPGFQGSLAVSWAPVALSGLCPRLGTSKPVATFLCSHCGVEEAWGRSEETSWKVEQRFGFGDERGPGRENHEGAGQREKPRIWDQSLLLLFLPLSLLLSFPPSFCSSLFVLSFIHSLVSHLTNIY